jgi:cytochrome c oxidase subunit II
MDTTGSLILPPASSTVAGNVDSVFYLILGVGIFFFILVISLAAFFIFKYHRRAGVPSAQTADHNIKLEIVWTVIPLIIVIIIFFMGFSVFLKLNIAPKDALEIKVTGQKWMWTFDYPNGATTANDLMVPAGKPIKLIMSSTDVIHSFFVPDFRVKMDVLPNRYTTLWFEAPNPGEHEIFCSQYCGRGHSEMVGRVKVLSEIDYANWLQTGTTSTKEGSLVEQGADLYKTKGCVACHTIDGGPSVGPTYKGLYGSTVKFSIGTTVLADDNYLRESILEPNAKIVAGFQPVMPGFQGVLKDREIDALIAYIKSLSATRNGIPEESREKPDSSKKEK